MGDLLRRIQTLATQSNLRFAVSARRPIAASEMHAEWPISLELEGNYHNLGLFLDRVSKFPRIINISGLTLVAKEPVTAKSSMTIAATATTFVLVDPARRRKLRRKNNDGPSIDPIRRLRRGVDHRAAGTCSGARSRHRPERPRRRTHRRLA